VPWSVEDTLELFEVMEGLESLIGELAAQRIADTEIAELQALQEEMLEDYREGRRSDYFNRNQLVHRRLAEVTRNGTLAVVYLNYASRIMRVRYLANFSQLRWEESTKEHAAFMAALAARDGILLGRLLREHLRRTAASVIAAMEQSDLFAPRGQPDHRGATGSRDGAVLGS
jgi:DNA-binding GntR family transcriptional regulator